MFLNCNDFLGNRDALKDLNMKMFYKNLDVFQVLCYEQVDRLHHVMETPVPIHGRGNFPTLEIKLKDLVQVTIVKNQSLIGRSKSVKKTRYYKINHNFFSRPVASRIVYLSIY